MMFKIMSCFEVLDDMVDGGISIQSSNGNPSRRRWHGNWQSQEEIGCWCHVGACVSRAVHLVLVGHSPCLLLLAF
jgi:hypothetical protein